MLTSPKGLQIAAWVQSGFNPSNERVAASVEPQQVVLGQTEAADGCVAAHAPRANGWPASRPRGWLGLPNPANRLVMRANSPRLLVVDVLAMYRQASGRSDNQYEADYNAIKGLQALALEHGVAIVVVHHTRKAGSDVDPFEKVSGTLGLSGAADTTIILDTDGSGATIYARGRDIEQIESAVEFDKQSCRWRVQGAASEVRRSDERSQILAMLEEAPDLMSPSDLAALTGKKNGAVRKLLHLMMKSGEVRKTKRGKYLHPSRTDLVTDADPLTPGNNGNKIISLDAYKRARDGEDAE
jgi:hypothetical protein